MSSLPPSPVDAAPGVSEAAAAAGGMTAYLTDLAELTKPGISLMVLVTTALGFVLASHGPLQWLRLAATLLGTGLVSAGASALNQVVERDLDARMKRTARRPLPSGRLEVEPALLFAVVLSLAGLTVLATAVNLLTALLGAVALAGYVFVYTPLKRITSLSTVVGAIPGAIPPMMGWCAVRNELELPAFVLFGILFFWQMPHFLAIAWLCRDDYAQGGFPMLPVIDPGGSWSGRQSVLYGAALVPVSLLPSILHLSGSLYFVGALILGIGYLVFALLFARERSTHSARRLMFASILYLPAIAIALLLDRLF
jgi:protoheme IX farnesyltransferase